MLFQRSPLVGLSNQPSHIDHLFEMVILNKKHLIGLYNQHDDRVWEDSFWFTFPSVDLNPIQPLVNASIVAPVVAVGSSVTDVVTLPTKSLGLTPFLAETDLDKFFAVPRLSVELTNYTPAGSFAAFGLWYQTPSVTAVLTPYYLFRGDLTVTVAYTGNPGLQGMVRIYAYPVNNYTDPYVSTAVATNFGTSGAPSGNVCRSSQLPHLDLDLSQSCVCSLKLPWPSPTNLQLINGLTDWTIYYGKVVNVKAANGTTPDPIPLDFYLSYENVKVSVLVPQGKEEGVVSSSLSYAAAIASIIPLPIATPISIFLEAGAGLARFFGWSRPPETMHSSMVNRSVGSMALASGESDFNYHMGLDPSVQHDINGVLTPLSSPGDTKLMSIMSRWSNLGVLAPATVILCNPSSYVTRTDGALEMTALGFVASCFQYWSGPLEFRFQFFSSPLVRTRVGITIVPPNATVPVTFNGDGSLLTQVADVVGPTEVMITVPYLLLTPMTTTQLYDYTSVHANYTRILWYIISGPLSTSPAPTAPDCLVSIRAAPGFEVAKPTLALVNTLKVVAQSLEEDVLPQGKEVSLPSVIGTGAQSLFAFGERVDSLQLLTRRYCPVFTATLAALTTGAPGVFYPMSGTVPYDAATAYGNITPVSNNWSYATWLRLAYFGWTGGNSWKVTGIGGLSNTPLLALQYFVAPGVRNTFNTNRINVACGTGEQLFDQNRTVEVSFPNRAYQNFNAAASYIIPGAPIACECIGVIPITASAATGTIVFYHAGADDYSFTGFLCAPVVYGRT